MSYLIAAISNDGGVSERAYRKMQEAAACPAKPFAEMFNFEVPSLMVGTLDSLMTISDDLGKTDQIVESVVRKIERAAGELNASGKRTDLNVGGVPTPRYIQQFAWDYAKYPNRRPLKELVSLIASGVTAVDEELKQLQVSYGDKQIALQEAKRNKGGNLLVADLNDALTEAQMMSVKVHNTDYLKTVFIAVPKMAQDTFEDNIYTIGDKIVGFGGPDWSRDSRSLGQAVKYGNQVDRHEKRGSPVVPGSLKLVTDDSESLLYCVTILKSQYEAGYYEGDEFQSGTTVDFEKEFATACREKRYVIREFEYDPAQASRNDMALEQLQVEVDSMCSGLARWCKTHYGEAFVAWMHVKVIRVFAESVLRYGLPVDFTSVLYKYNGDDSRIIGALDNALGSADDIEDDGVDVGDEDDYHDFVLLKFEP